SRSACIQRRSLVRPVPATGENPRSNQRDTSHQETYAFVGMPSLAQPYDSAAPTGCGMRISSGDSYNNPALDLESTQKCIGHGDCDHLIAYQNRNLLRTRRFRRSTLSVTLRPSGSPIRDARRAKPPENDESKKVEDLPEAGTTLCKPSARE